MWCIRVGANFSVKGKQQDFHSGKSKISHKFPDIVCNYAKVLCNEGQFIRSVLPDTLGQGFKEFSSRGLGPLSVYSRFFFCRHCPTRRETPEMIYPYKIEVFQRLSESGCPPAEAVPSHGLPVIKRVSPSLSARAEVVRGDSRHFIRRTLRIKVKIFLIRPYIRTVKSDKHGDIPHQSDIPLLTVSVKSLPLPVKNELFEADQLNFLVFIFL
ncbi:hypothetical protein SDC9_114040 [bioreactor metagenome]|uniref:Uncharacterized protein n=1 Tax=bioreactor metagenome TaxID=1076179 RepID=A0A645BV82_9ZZZZ